MLQLVKLNVKAGLTHQPPSVGKPDMLWVEVQISVPANENFTILNYHSLNNDDIERVQCPVLLSS